MFFSAAGSVTASDTESAGYAVFMEWLNPEHHPIGAPAAVRNVRVAAVQYQMRPISSFDEFAQQCEFFIDTASEYRADFLLFPEMVTNQLQVLVQVKLYLQLKKQKNLEKVEKVKELF